MADLAQCSKFLQWDTLAQFKSHAIASYIVLKKEKEAEGIKNFRQLGEVGCYCQYLKENTCTKLDTVRFTGLGDRALCKEWNDYQIEYFWFRMVYPVLIVILINGLVAYLIGNAVVGMKMNDITR